MLTWADQQNQNGNNQVIIIKNGMDLTKSHICQKYEMGTKNKLYETNAQLC